jgi:hypothetical protein
MPINIKKLKRAGKGTPPAPTATHHNLSKPPASGPVPIQVNVAPEFRRKYRTYAAEHEIELSKLFVAMAEYYWEHHG